MRPATRKEVPQLLSQIPTHELEAELDRRADAGKPTRDYHGARRWYCTGCLLLKFAKTGKQYEGEDELDATCKKGHPIVFRIGKDWAEMLDGDEGHHRKDRKKCGDYVEKEPREEPES